MELHKNSIVELKSLLDKKEISSRELTEYFLNRIENVDEKINAFITVTKDEALKEADNIDKKRAAGEELAPLSGIPMALKDNIVTKDVKTTCASKMLSDFIPPYDATVVEKLKENGAILLGKVNLDEFAMGSSCECSAIYPTKNPWNIEKVPGGSSGGSAAAVAAGEAAFTLGSDTGGSIRQPAAFCGVVGLKPTYGRVSRYGVVALASSLDHVGTFTNTVEDAALVLEAIAGHDPLDASSSDSPVPNYLESIQGDIKGMKIGIPKEYFPAELNEEVKESILGAAKKLEELGAVVEECSLPHTKYALSVYHILVAAEASSSLGRFDGVRYGYRASSDNIHDMFIKTRSEGFGDEVKRRILLGTYFLSSGQYEKYYLKALKARTLIKNDFENIFTKYDALLTPTTLDVAFNIGEKSKESLSMYMGDLFTVAANLAGVPAISVPCGLVSEMPVGFQLIGKHFAESDILKIALNYEKNSNFKDLKPREVK